MSGIVITRITKQDIVTKVHDIEVEGAHHYFFENGVLSHNSMYPTNEAAGGGGFKYACSTILTLGKAKDKDGTEVVGTFIRVKTMKSRLTKENNEVRLRLSYKTGLDRYFGLLDLAEKYGIFKKVSTRYELPDGRKVFGKEINDNPEKYYTPEIMKRLEEAAHQEFSYGEGETPTDEPDEFFESEPQKEGVQENAD